MKNRKVGDEELNSVADAGEGPGGPGGPGPPLFLDQTENIFFGDRATILSKGLDDPPPPPPGLDPAVLFTTQTLTIRHLCCHLFRSHGGAEAGRHKPEHILFLKVH